MISTTLTHLLVLVVVDALPTAGEPARDPECEEWVLTDSDGISYCGPTPAASSANSWRHCALLPAPRLGFDAMAAEATGG
jgi:hypothetical protein